MPSLRRTLSSPAVRSSPYPSSLSLGSPSASRMQQNAHRRSTGSETTTRRVLADIEWWRVADGQRDTDNENGSEDGALEDRDGVGHILSPDDILEQPSLLSVDSGAERSFSPLDLPSSYWSGSAELSPLSPIIHLSSLSLAPQTPPLRHHVLESSSSSLESSPESSHTLESVRLGMEYLDLGFNDVNAQPPLIKRGRSDTLPSLISLHMRSFEDHLDGADMGHYVDFSTSPLSSMPLGLLN